MCLQTFMEAVGGPDAGYQPLRKIEEVINSNPAYFAGVHLSYLPAVCVHVRTCLSARDISLVVCFCAQSPSSVAWRRTSSGTRHARR